MMPPRHALRSIVPVVVLLRLALCAEVTALEPRERRTTLVTGIELRSVELGPPGGEPVLFLHGYTDSSRSFLPTMERLAGLRPELRLIALDLRGHGGSSLPAAASCRARPQECFRLADLAADVRSFVALAGIERYDVVGHSLGSLVAQELALADPAVRRMVLIGSAAAVGDNADFYAFIVDGLVEGPWREALVARGLRFPEDAYELTPMDADPRAEEWIASNWAVEAGGDAEHLAAIARDAARTPLAAWIGVPRALRGHDRRSALVALEVPTLVLWGRGDAIFPEVPDQTDLRAALGASSPRCGRGNFWKAHGRAAGRDPVALELGHNLHWGAPDAVAADLAAFLLESGRPTAELAYFDAARARTARAPAAAEVLAPSAEGCGW